jgi:hypothetical protein
LNSAFYSYQHFGGKDPGFFHKAPPGGALRREERCYRGRVGPGQVVLFGKQGEGGQDYVLEAEGLSYLIR